jgi:dTDP-4-amino-4,6-dideoxygalactose transaminase
MVLFKSFRYQRVYQWTTGSAIPEIFREYLDVKHVIPCANGTDALQIAMMGLDLKPGDEVITADLRLLQLWK